MVVHQSRLTFFQGGIRREDCSEVEPSHRLHHERPRCREDEDPECQRRGRPDLWPLHQPLKETAEKRYQWNISATVKRVGVIFKTKKWGSSTEYLPDPWFAFVMSFVRTILCPQRKSEIQSSKTTIFIIFIDVRDFLNSVLFKKIGTCVMNTNDKWPTTSVLRMLCASLTFERNLHSNR